VFIAYASIHGNTANAAKLLAEELKAAGEQKVSVCDLAREDMAEAVEDAFRYDRIVLAAATYDGGIFTWMEEFLHHLKAKNFQKRKVALIENGTWAPMAAKQMRATLETLKEIEIVEPIVSIKSALSETNKEEIRQLAKTLCQ
jgi:flavorubredoxin